MTVLYHVTGACYSLPDTAWSQALEIARQRGWKPSPTLTPPVSLDAPGRSEWNGAYEPAAGQEVTRKAAAGMAAALREGEDPDWLTGLWRFAARGGFLICEVKDSMAGSLQRLAEATQAARLEVCDPICRRADSRGAGPDGAESTAGAPGAGRSRR